MTLSTQNQLSSLQRELLSLLADFGPSSSGVLHASVSGSVSFPKLTRSLGQLEALGLIEETT